MEEERVLPERPLADRIRQRFDLQIRVPFERRVRAPLRRLRNASREYHPIFVTGAIGSGTTLLAFSLGQRFECGGVVQEGALQIARDSFLYVPSPDTFASIREYQEHFTPKPWWSVDQGRADLQAMYRSYATGASDLVFDKGPNVDLVRVPFLDACFPDARYVMIFRDPVVNIEGFQRKWSLFGRSSLDECIRFYQETHERFLQDAEGLGDRALIVEYERLVQHYEEGLEVLQGRLDLEEAKERRRLRTRANVEGQGIRNVRRGEIGVVRSSSQRVYRRLARETIDAVQSALGPLHERLRARAVTVDG